MNATNKTKRLFCGTDILDKDIIAAKFASKVKKERRMFLEDSNFEYIIFYSE